MMRQLPALMAFLALLLVAPGVFAHGPPKERDQDVRLLADHNDDCGGDEAGSGSLSNCHGTHDLVGLDLVERHDGGLGDVVVLRLIVNGGSGSLKDVITLKVDGTTKTLEVRTSDNQQFTGTGFASITRMTATNADGTADGSRFIIEGSVKQSDLGPVGAKVTDYAVDAFVDGSKGDYMPGGYVSGLGVTTSDPPQGDAVTSYNKVNGYVLRGPTYYTSVAMASSAAVRADDETVVPLQVKNLLRNTAQLATVSVEGADGFTATWVGANGADPAQLDLAKDETKTAELRLRGDGHAPTTGTLTITVSTSLGGYTTHQLPYEILAGENVGGPGTGHVDPKGKDSPTAAGVVVAIALLAVASLRRRA